MTLSHSLKGGCSVDGGWSLHPENSDEMAGDGLKLHQWAGDGSHQGDHVHLHLSAHRCSQQGREQLGAGAHPDLAPKYTAPH